MPTFRAAVFGSTLAALAAYVLITAYILPNLVNGIDASWHWFGASTIRGWGAALSADPALVQRLAEGVYGEARIALIALTLAILFIYCFLRPSISKETTKKWFAGALILLLALYTLVDILSLKWPVIIEGWIEKSGFVVGRALYVLNNLDAGPVTIASFGSMAAIVQLLGLVLLALWIVRRK